MPAYFLDSSAIVKRYLIERGSSWVKDLTDPARRNRCYLVGIAGAEVVAALARRASLGGPSQTMLLNAIADFRRDFSLDFRVIDVTTTLISSTTQP